MNKIQRRLHRFRAGIYGRLPENRKLSKLGISLFLLLALLLLYRIHSEWSPGDPASKDEESTETMSDAFVTPDSPEASLREQDAEQGHLSVSYIAGGAVRTTQPSDSTPSAAGEQSANAAAADVGQTGSTASGQDSQTAESQTDDDPAQTADAQESVAAGSYQTVVSLTGFTPACYPKLSDIVGKKYLLDNLKQLSYLQDTFYIVNATTKMTSKDFPVERFLATDLSIQKTEASPQILIYHTHASEAFLDSRPGVEADTVVGMGELLATYLTQKYGYHVLHDTTVFDMKNGKDNRSYAYNDAYTYISALLKEYPDIEVIIDLHRDAGTKRVATVQGKQVAKVMLFNGLCRNTTSELEHLPNKNLFYNLAFSFQMKLIGNEMYPGLMNRIFLKDYRYNMHLAERYLLIELGTNNNTVEEAANAMEPLADILAQVLRPD